MAIYTWDAIFLGSAIDIDSGEGSLEAEEATNILGTYGSLADPLWQDVVSFQVDDADEDTNINTDNSQFTSPEPVLIDGVSKTPDSGVVYDATITYTDGTTAAITAVIMQTTDGSLYLLPEMSQNADFDAMQAKPIASISLNSVLVNPTFVGANRVSTNFETESVACLAAGTEIRVPNGDIPIQYLRKGDLVMTVDDGLQAIQWVGSRRVSIAHQIAKPSLRAIEIEAGALGAGVPKRRLVLSQQHRIMACSRIAGRMFGSAEILIPAKKLLGLPGVREAVPTKDLKYYHIALSKHGLITANNAPVETLFDWSGMVTDANSDLAPDRLVRPVYTGRKLDRFLARHAANRMPLCNFPCKVSVNEQTRSQD